MEGGSRTWRSPAGPSRPQTAGQVGRQPASHSAACPNPHEANPPTHLPDRRAARPCRYTCHCAAHTAVMRDANLGQPTSKRRPSASMPANRPGPWRWQRGVQAGRQVWRAGMEGRYRGRREKLHKDSSHRFVSKGDVDGIALDTTESKARNIREREREKEDLTGSSSKVTLTASPANSASRSTDPTK